MYSVSNKYKAEIVKKSLRYSWQGTITFADSSSISFNHENIDQNKSKLTKQCVKGENLEVGNVFAGELVLGLRDTADWQISSKNYEYYGATISLTFRLLYSDNTYEDVPCGVYKITEAKRTYHTVELTAYDAIHDLEAKIPAKMQNNLDAYDALTELCRIAGVTFGDTQQSVQSLPNGLEDFPTGVYEEGTSCSEIFGNICTFLGVNAVCNRSGAVVLSKYGLEPVRTILASNRYSSSYVDYIGQYTKFAYINKKGNEVEYGNATQDPAATKQLTMNLGRNNMIKKMTATRVHALLDNTLDSVKDIIYAPCDIAMPSDPALDIGDLVTITGGELGADTVDILCTKMTMPLFGQQKIVSEGGNYTFDASNNRTKKEKEQRNDEIDQDIIDEHIEEIDESITDIDEDITEMRNDISDLQGAIYVGYILPSLINLTPIADGGTSKVLEFTFSCDGDNEVVSLYSMLSFTIATTLSNSQYNDAVLTVTYKLDNVTKATAAHTYTDGSMILTLNGFFGGLSSGSHVIEVTFAMAGGSLS